MTPEPVAPSLKQRFSDWIDERTALGVTKYGTPLMTFNGRDSGQDMVEEILDFCQYQQQHIMELEALLESHGILWTGEKFNNPAPAAPAPLVRRDN